MKKIGILFCVIGLFVHVKVSRESKEYKELRIIGIICRQQSAGTEAEQTE
jgi:hypothetical protein